MSLCLSRKSRTNAKSKLRELAGYVIKIGETTVAADGAFKLLLPQSDNTLLQVFSKDGSLVQEADVTA